ncbi:MAG: UDP-N-acetylmuramyl-tripeptide synthetase [Candidatus Liptonbacteria bacterium]
MDKLIEFLRKFPLLRKIAALPALSRPYHYLMGFLGALWYWFPSHHLTIIGITGTKGKTTTSTMVWHILRESGYVAGLATTVNFRIGDRELINERKQTMLGRFALQKLLRQMVNEGCTHAVLETSSWGIAQYRHRFVKYDIAAFTNITPEHIEQHGGFEAYRTAKVRLFEHVGQSEKGIGAYNLDDKNVTAFLGPRMPIRYGYALNANGANRLAQTISSFKEIIYVSGIDLKKDKNTFRVGGVKFSLPLPGEFNVQNAACAISVARSLDIPLEQIAKALSTMPPVAGRMEVLQARNKPTVIIDYAHEPASLEAIYRAAQTYHPKKVIGVLGSQGGGRDIWKREAMGRIAAKYLNTVILTNEDPYDDDPLQIMDDIEKGIVKSSRGGAAPEIYKIVDRKEALRKAISMATKDDVVIATGKGGEVWMCIANERKIPWNEREAVEDVLNEKSRAEKSGGLLHGGRVREIRGYKKGKPRSGEATGL